MVRSFSNSMKVLKLRYVFFVLPVIILLGFTGYFAFESSKLKNSLQVLGITKSNLDNQFSQVKKDFEDLKNQDQVNVNKKNTEEINNIQNTYNKTVKAYEQLLSLKEQTNKTQKNDEMFSQILSLLSKKDYVSAEAKLAEMTKAITEQKNQIAAAYQAPKNVATNNTPPTAGSSATQQVQTSAGTFTASIISADLNSTKVIVDTVSSSDCANDCPVMSLGEYAQRSGAFAGVNGPYFCPAAYPSCAGKTNSFDTLIMNKDKTYFNSGNNVYSVVPAVIFSGGSARFVSQSLEWGRDTGVDAVIASQPLLLRNGEIVYGNDAEAKRLGKGTRAFIGSAGNTVYIGVVHNATTAEMAHVLKTLGIQNALNLDSGGSIALWNNGRYLAGPGRNTPFGILLVRK